MRYSAAATGVSQGQRSSSECAVRLSQVPLYTETAIARVLSDILMALDRGDVAALALMDLSAAFDTVDHCILLRRLCGIWHQRSGAELDQLART